ncbi:MAG: hypothetical protein ACP5XB_23315, partial [Isosphaeraceae bacterium]
LEEFRDPVLARGHFGYAVELARKAIPAGFSGTLPRERPANAPFFQAIDGLLACLKALGKTAEADNLAALARRLGGSASWNAKCGMRSEFNSAFRIPHSLATPHPLLATGGWPHFIRPTGYALIPAIASKQTRAPRPARLTRFAIRRKVMVDHTPHARC